jgi:phosphomannomutase
MRPLDPIVKAYDIRGTVPDQLDAETVQRLAAGFAAFAREQDPGVQRVLVARDMRASGVELAEAAMRGICAQGLDVVDLGLASTDLLFFASGDLAAPGMMLTASHNPAQYNGLKLCLAGAKPVGQDTGLDRIKHLAAEGLADAPELGARSEQSMLERFAQHVHTFVDRDALRPLRIVADTANGMGGLIVPAVFDGLPFEVDVLYGELDGTFPNHPADPIQEANQADCKARMAEIGADVGLCFDGDADRVFLVDDRGVSVSGSTTTAIVAGAVLEREPGATILHNLICSRAVPEIIKERGGTPVRTRVGHSFVKQVMAETGAAFGGEHSGHYYFRENFRADSGIIAALVVLEQVCLTGKPLSELRKPYERYCASGERNTEVADPAAVIERVAAALSDGAQDRLDGLTIEYEDWWCNLRPSNTEPLLRLNVEAATDEAVAERVAQVQQLMISD